MLNSENKELFCTGAVLDRHLLTVNTQETTEEVQINVRLPLKVREEFRIAAKLRGLTMSGLLHQYIRKTIKEEKQSDPEPFLKYEQTDSIPVLSSETVAKDD